MPRAEKRQLIDHVAHSSRRFIICGSAAMPFHSAALVTQTLLSAAAATAALGGLAVPSLNNVAIRTAVCWAHRDVATNAFICHARLHYNLLATNLLRNIRAH